MCVCQCVALAGFAQGVEFRDISFAGALKAAKAEKQNGIYGLLYLLVRSV